jgi:Family of unknown function (DUF5908)
MPIEIKELVIRTVVGNAQGAVDPPAEERGGAGGSDASSTEEIVQECVRQVLRVLSKDKER